MRPIRLSIKGINSFIDEQVIDFEKLSEQGFFGVFGPTGSGKSSILDAMTLALYGVSLRENTASGGNTNFINSNCERASVSLEFSMSGAQTKYYLVEREFRLNKKNATATAYKAKLVELGDTENVLEDRAKAVTKKCEEIIGLSESDFQRTVILPQGKFSEFLKLSGAGRREMLERLFGLQKYGVVLNDKLKKAISKANESMAVLTGEASTYSNISNEILTEKKVALNKARTDEEEFSKQLEQLGAKYTECDNVWQLMNEADIYTTRKKELEDKKQLIDKLEDKLKEHEKAVVVNDLYKEFKAESDKYKLLKDEYKTYEAEAARLLEKTVKAKTEYESIKNLHDDRLKDYAVASQILSSATENMHKLSEEKQLFASCDDKEVQLEDELKLINKALGEYNDKKQSNVTLKAEISKQIEANEVLPEYKKLIYDGFAISKDMANYEKEYKNIDEQRKKHTKSVDELKAVTDKEKEELAEINQRILKCSEESDELDKNIPGTSEDVLKAQTRISQAKANAVEYDRIVSDIALSTKKLTDIQKSKEISLKLYNEAKTSMEQEKEQLLAIEYDMIANKLRNTLTVGKPCPVCGVIHENNATVVDNLENSDIDTQELSSRIDKLNDSCNKYKAEIIAADRQLKQELDNAAEIKNKLDEHIEEHGIVDVKALESDFEKLRLRVASYDAKHLEYIEIQKKLNDEFNKLNLSVNTHTSELESNSKLLNQYNEELKKTSVNAEQLRKQLEDLIANSKIDNEATSYAKELKSIEDKEKTVYNLRKELATINEEEIKLDKKIDELSIKLNELMLEKTRIIAQKKTCENNILELTSGYNRYLDTAISTVDNTKDLKIECIDRLNIALVRRDAEDAKQLVNEVIEYINTTYKCKEDNLTLLTKQTNENENKKTAAYTSMQNSERYLKSYEENYINSLQKHEFADYEAVKSALLDEHAHNAAANEIEAYKTQVNDTSTRLNVVQEKLAGRSITKAEWEEIKELRQTKKQELETVREQVTLLTAEVENIKKQLSKVKDIIEKQKKLEHRLAILSELSKLLAGKKFVEYAAGERIKYISREASKRLKEITNGTYELKVNDDFEYVLIDNKNGGAIRTPSTLSGGETFVASLALALALSHEIQLKGQTMLELFFLDEGFGTLDDDLLDVVMSSLERIHNDRLRIGIISHVESVKARVPVKLIVTPAASGGEGSKVTMEYS